jgi:two-component system, OmpR family, sensor histidine kinase BaeS
MSRAPSAVKVRPERLRGKDIWEWGPEDRAPGEPEPGPVSMTVRLLFVQAIVLLIALGVVAATTLLIGPQMYVGELLRQGHGRAARAIFELNDVFRSVSLLSVTIGGLTAFVVATSVSFLITRQIRRSIDEVGRAANRVAAGEYDVRLSPSQLGAEFDDLTGSFNDMAARLNAVDQTRRQMLADLAHEMRTPLANLKGHLEGIEDGIVILDDRTSAILAGQVNRLEHLAQDMKSLTQAEEGMVHLSPSLQDPAELMVDVVAASQQLARGREVELSAAMPRVPIAPVAMDRARMEQVLSNLVDNALRHTPDGGQVTVGLADSGGEVVYTVRDTGEGIVPEDLSRIFMRFYRVGEGREAKPGGSGLGLAISKALVQAQGGTLAAASDGPGQGAVFTVRLPRR